LKGEKIEHWAAGTSWKSRKIAGPKKNKKRRGNQTACAKERERASRDTTNSGERVATATYKEPRKTGQRVKKKRGMRGPSNKDTNKNLCDGISPQTTKERKKEP